MNKKILAVSLVACSLTFAGEHWNVDAGDIVHLRPSGNAPEFRCYVETEGKDRSAELLADCMKIMEGWRM